MPSTPFKVINTRMYIFLKRRLFCRNIEAYKFLHDFSIKTVLNFNVFGVAMCFMCTVKENVKLHVRLKY